jgi:TPR repeat protein
LRLHFGFRTLVLIAGVVLGCAILAGSFFFKHFDLRMRPQKAACRAGDTAACLAVGEKYEAERSIFGGWAAAQGYYEAGCDAGSARSCLKLARISSKDDAIWNDAKQLKGYGLACDANIAEACFELGWTYAVGYRIKQDYSRSTPALERGCTGGNADACYWLGLSAAGGWGAAPDPERARALFGSACDGGSGEACEKLR